MPAAGDTGGVDQGTENQNDYRTQSGSGPNPGAEALKQKTGAEIQGVGHRAGFDTIHASAALGTDDPLFAVNR